jgi:hypothetical protein
MGLLEAATRDVHQVPGGVCIRLATLLPPEDVAWVGVHIVPSGSDGYPGSACVLTTALVVLVTMEPGKDHQPAARVEAWSRADLRSLEIPSDPAAEPFASLPACGWPRTARVALRYDNREDPLVLPLQDDRESRESFASILPSLMADLSR